MREQKSELRARHLSLRDTIPTEIRIEAALALAAHAPALLERTEGRIVAGYHPIRSELDPRPLMAALSNIRLCLPVIVDKTSLHFRELLRTGTLVDAGGHGTIGPPESAAILDPQVLLMPLSVFDPQGGRIGYGAGYYDRAIADLGAKNTPPLCIGVAFDEQEADAVPQEAHDMPLDLIVTPSRMIEIAR